MSILRFATPMIQVITHCDRCNKMLDRDEGHGVQIWAKRNTQVGPGLYTPSVPFCADICDGCRTMLDFFFVGKFKEEVQSA